MIKARNVDVIVDGQFGSTGKGQLAGFIHYNRPLYDCYISNSGSQAGHTFKNESGDPGFITRHTPVGGVLNKDAIIILSAACIIDIEVLVQEIMMYELKGRIFVSSKAAVIDNSDKITEERHQINRIGSTGKGNGSALANKIQRVDNAIIGHEQHITKLRSYGLQHIIVDDLSALIRRSNNILIEGAQGYSLSLDGPFYPYCTSRNCWVGQALADAWIHPNDLRDTYMVIRTRPIRVGGNSGPCYSDQRELNWKDEEIEPEYTTVTGRQRRLFSFSLNQVIEAVKANRPTYLAISHLDYLGYHEAQVAFIDELIRHIHNRVGYVPNLIYGRGPYLNNWSDRVVRL